MPALGRTPSSRQLHERVLLIQSMLLLLDLVQLYRFDESLEADGTEDLERERDALTLCTETGSARSAQV